MQLNMNFYEDLSNHVRPNLEQPNFKIHPGTDSEEIMMRFLNWATRRIAPMPRMIHRSKEFACPTDFEQPLRNLEEKVQNGANLNPHLSKRLTQATKKAHENDLMFNTSKVHHLHLGNSIGADGYVERTGPLLFVLVTDLDFYEIDIYDHKNHWTDSGVMKIVRNNWPALINSCGTGYIEGWEHETTDEESFQLGKAGINDFTRLVASSFGGGITTAGSSLRVVRESTIIRRILKKLEQIAVYEINRCIPELQKEGLNENDSLEVRLKVDDATGILYAFVPRFDIRIEF